MVSALLRIVLVSTQGAHAALRRVVHLLLLKICAARPAPEDALFPLNRTSFPLRAFPAARLCCRGPLPLRAPPLRKWISSARIATDNSSLSHQSTATVPNGWLKMTISAEFSTGQTEASDSNPVTMSCAR